MTRIMMDCFLPASNSWCTIMLAIMGTMSKRISWHRMFDDIGYRMIDGCWLGSLFQQLSVICYFLPFSIVTEIIRSHIIITVDLSHSSFLLMYNMKVLMMTANFSSSLISLDTKKHSLRVQPFVNNGSTRESRTTRV